MKKSSGKPSKGGISKQVAQVARGLVASPSIDPLKTGNSLDGSSKNGIDREQQLRMKQYEDEIMGETGGEGKKSEVMERNLNQMVEVLRMRLNSLEGTAKLRMHLLDEDRNANSVECSEQAPKITDEFEDINTKTLKDPKFTGSGAAHRENLITVAADKVFVDANRLVLRTKAISEAGKKLEMELEESFGTSNLRDLKGKKAKAGLSRTEKSKKTEQQKFEAKKAARMKLEKDLQSNQENYLTRSVADPELYFLAPGVTGVRRTKRRSTSNAVADLLEGSDIKEGDLGTTTGFGGSEYIPSSEPLDPDCIDPVRWPISVKWSSKDPRSKHPENSEGEMDPGLLLRYAVERITLPSGENMFRWLVRQTMVHNYFVYLFWLIKVKFFDGDSDPENEKFLLRNMGAEYVKIVDLLARRARAEYEKDFAFKFLPFILTNAVHYAFFFLCPGSRHLYSKGFKKTILMQTVKVMYGIQLCTATVKVQWAKLFPEDVHEGEEDLEEGGESFPVQIAFSDPEKYAEKETERAPSPHYHMFTATDNSSPPRNGASGQARGGILADAHAAYGHGPSADLYNDFSKDFNDEFSVHRSLDSYDSYDGNGSAYSGSPSARSRGSRSAGSSSPQRARSRGSNHLSPHRRTMRHTGIGQPPVHTHPGKRAADRQVAENISHAIAKLSTSGSVDSLSKSASFSGVPHRKTNRLMPILARNLKKGLMSRAEAIEQGMARFATGLLPNPYENTAEAAVAAQAEVDETQVLDSERNEAIGDAAEAEACDATGADATSCTESSAVTTERSRATRANSIGLPPRPEKKSQEFTSFIMLQAQAATGNPLTRTVLKPIPGRPPKINPLTHRQLVEGLDAKSMSPVIHKFLDTEAPSGHKNPQVMRRTVPVNWCVAGGSDTYKKRHIPKELHEEMSLKATRSEKEFQTVSLKGRLDRIHCVYQAKKNCESVLKSSEPSAVSRFCLDIVRNQRVKVRGGAGGGAAGKDFIYSVPMETNAAPSADDLLLADENLDDDLDEFLASI